MSIKAWKETPLTFACERGNICEIVHLIKGGADVNKSNGIKTPLIVACEMGNITVVKRLINAGVDIDQSDGNKPHLWLLVEKTIGSL